MTPPRIAPTETHSAKANGPSAARPTTYTVDEVAALLRISRSTAYLCIHSGQLPSIRLRRRIVVPAAAVDRLLAATDIGPTTR